MKSKILAVYLAILGLLCIFVPSAFADDKKNNILYIYNWSEYIPNHLLVKFTEQTGIEVRYTTYESNEEMYSKLKITRGEGYDLIFPSHYYVGLLVRDDLIQPLDKKRINLDNVIADLLVKSEQFDPKNTYTIPYAYGFTVIGVNADKYNPAEITSWKDLWDSKYSDLIMLNDMIDNFSIALMARGINPNAATDAQIQQAVLDLEQLDKKVVQYNSDSPELPFIDGSSNIGVIWTGSAFRAQQEALESMRVVYPKEGANLWMDNFAIPKKAKNVDAAYKFINFILEPEHAYEITKEIGFQTANSKVKALMPREWRENPILFPSKEVYDKAIINQVPVEQLDYYLRLWNKIKVSN